MISPRFVFLAAAVLFIGGISIGHAQESSSGSPSDSLGDAARKARAQKKDSSKPAKVFTNDDLGGLKGTISVVGNEPTPGSATDSKQTPGDSKKEGAKDETYWRTKFAAARKTLADDTKQLDIMQREFNLKQQQFYQDPTVAMKEQHSRDDLNKTQSEIDAKKQDVEKDKQALSDLEDELRKSGGQPGWANEPSGTGSSESSGSGTAAAGAGAADSGRSNSGTTAQR